MNPMGMNTLPLPDPQPSMGPQPRGLAGFHQGLPNLAIKKINHPCLEDHLLSNPHL